MVSVFPLKAILETKSARFLQDVSGVDSTNPRLKNKSFFFRPTLRCITSFISSDSTDNVEESCLEKKQVIMHCLGIIVEDAVDQMHILSFGKKSDNCLRKFELSLDQRLTGLLYDDPIYDMETGDLHGVAFAKRKLNKNLDDCAVCREFLIIIKNELKADKSFNSVKDIMNTIIRKRKEEVTLLKDEMNNYSKMKEYKLNLISHSRNYQSQVQKINEILANSEDKTQELLFKNLMRGRYINEWESSRQEQNKLSCKKREKEMEDIITKYQFEIDKEIRINNEIQSFITENLTDLEHDIKYWVAKYEKDSENTNTQIQILRDRKDEQEKHFEELRELFAKHKKEIKNFKAYKEKKRLDDEENERQTIAAIKIQAWWRGNMVRHQLGRFNPNRGKKGKKNKKKKK